MKYKVGDKVRITRNINGHGFGIGDIVEIITVDTKDKKLPYCAMSKSGLGGKWFNGSECKLIKQGNLHDSYDIHITSNGIYTNCVYEKNGEIVSTSSAKLNETDGDVFSMKEGARLCIERLEDDKKKYSGKIICVKTDFSDFTVGKIYEVKNGFLLDDDGHKWSNDKKYFKLLKEINNYFGKEDEYKSKFIELVED